MSTNAKDLRKQVRNVVLEILPGVLTKEVVDAIVKSVNSRLDKIEKDNKDSIAKINERHKDVMSFLVRQVSKPDSK